MNRQEFQDMLWSELPAIRKRLVGKKRAERLAKIAIEQCPVEILQHVQEGGKQREVLLAAWRANVKKRYCVEHGEDAVTFGPLFWILISPVLQYIVKRILEWWFESRSHRVILAGWQKEMTA